MKKKYNNNFERDVRWYFKMRHTFDFDGALGYWNKKGEHVIQADTNGMDGIEAFHQWDSNGKILPTKHPNILFTLLKIKGGCNLHIKMYAEDRAACNMNFIEFRALCIKFKAPSWFRDAVERQKVKYWAENIELI